MTNKVPHVLPYQGSKRKISSEILSHINFNIDTLYEPFAGSAAITLAAAKKNIAKNFFISDKLKSITDLWSLVINDPISSGEKYEKIWLEQLDNPKEYFVKIRDRYNETQDPIDFLYLTARSVKNAVRFNSQGEFNQSPDNRRLGVRPEKIKLEMVQASNLLKGIASSSCLDFSEALELATEKDLLYLDPPWQGTSSKKDTRYAHLLNMDLFIEQLDYLNNKGIPFILSFDGKSGTKSYGVDLPISLNLKKYTINAGRSTQATLNGKNDITYESLYLSPAFLKKQL